MHLRDVELFRHMPEGTVEDTPLAMAALPHDGHDDVLGPVGMLARERRRRQHLIRRVDVHVVLLGTVVEVPDPLHDRIVGRVTFTR